MLKTSTVAFFVMLITVTGSSAAMLGSSKGSVYFGRSFDISVPIDIGDPQDEMTKCFTADVYQGEAMLDSGRIRIDVVTSDNKQKMIRVRSISIITEPWAKMILHSNCGAKVTRQYDFLTDFVNDLPMVLTQTGGVAKNDTRNTPEATPSITTTPLKPLTEQQIKTIIVPKAQKKIKETTNKNSMQSVMTATTKPKPISAARLKMEAFEFTNESSVMLKLSSALTEPTGMRTNEEVQALAQATAIWRTINGMSTQHNTNTAQKTDLIKSNTEATTTAKVDLPKTTLNTNSNSNAFDSSLMTVSTQDFNNPLVYVLMSMLALTLACIAWLWYRVQKTSKLGYAWLSKDAQEPQANDYASDQFLPTAFADTDFIRESKTSDESIRFEYLQPLDNGTVKQNDTQGFEPSLIGEQKPPHFDDSRNEERQLNVHKNRTDLIPEQPINSTEELIDAVAFDSKPALRETPISTSTLGTTSAKVSLGHLPAEQSTPMMKTDNSNLAKSDVVASDAGTINFEIFGEPATKEKSPRIV